MTETLGERLQAAMEKSGKTDRHGLATAVGISVQAIGLVLNGSSKSLTAENCSKAATYLGVRTDWLATGMGTMRGEESVCLPIELDASPSIPQYDVAGAMGNGGLVLDEQPPGIIKSWNVDEQWLRMNVPAHTGFQNLCIVTGFGSSMQPMFNPGDPLLMDKGVTECRSDGVYFFRIGDHGYIKQLQRIPTANGLVIKAKSLNTSYDPFDITDGMDFHVLGRILLIWRSDRV